MSRWRWALGVLATLVWACERAEPLPVIAPADARERLLVVAPHIDDEALGAGGYMLDGTGRGALVTVVYLTCGDGNIVSAALDDWTVDPRARDFLREGRTRLYEAKTAMAFVGVPQQQQFFLGYPDHFLLTMSEHPGMTIESRRTGARAVPYAEALSPGSEYRYENLVRDLRTVFSATRPDVVITPAAFDDHPDHKAAAGLTAVLIGEMRPRPRVLTYLVHARHFPSPFLLDRGASLRPPSRLARRPWHTYSLSGDTRKRKERLLAMYRSQRRDPYLRLLLDSFIRTNELFVVPPGNAR